jgi:type IV secretion system protein VirB10
MLQDSTANIEEMKRSLEIQQRQSAMPKLEPQTPIPTQPAQPGMPPYAATDAMAGYNCTPGQPCPTPAAPPYGSYQQPQQLSPQQQEQLQLQQQERELAYKARFASNLAYSQSHAISGPSSLIATNRPTASVGPTDLHNVATTSPWGVSSYGVSPSVPYNTAQQPSSAMQPAPQSQAQARSTLSDSQSASTYKRATEVNINSAIGEPYVVYEGTLIETALINRLDGDASGPVKVLVTNPVYSHDHQHVLIPEGTVVLGESRKIGGAGFGQQRRLAILFHRMIMPDGYSVDLDQFQGLNQIGETGLKDKINNHYLQIFGASIALGIVAGAAEASNNNSVLTADGADAYKYGVGSSLSQSATTVLDQFINIPPTITIREGHRVKVYLSQDLLLPAYENHSILSSF